MKLRSVAHVRRASPRGLSTPSSAQESNTVESEQSRARDRVGLAALLRDALREGVVEAQAESVTAKAPACQPVLRVIRNRANQLVLAWRIRRGA